MVRYGKPAVGTYLCVRQLFHRLYKKSKIDISHCLRSEKKFHFDFDFFHFYLIKSVIWQPPAMHPGDWPE